MKTRLRHVGVAAACTTLLFTTACGAVDTGTSQNNTASASTELPASCKNAGAEIGVLLPNLTNPYYVAMKKGFEDEAKAKNFTAKVLIANDNDADQLAQAQTLIQGKPCAIALNPVNSEPAAAIVKAANDAKIPVFTVNVGVSDKALKAQGGYFVQYLGADNVAGGSAIAEQLLKDMGKDAKLTVGLVTAPDQTIVVTRDDGFKKGLSSNPNAKVAATVDGKVQLDTSLNVTSAMLQGNPEMNVIFASTGPATQGALEAVKASGRDVKVYGFCASELETTKQYPACVAQEPEDYGKRVIDQIRNHVDGQKVDAEILRPLKLFTTGQKPAAGEVG